MQFDVAISFAGEDRPVAQTLAKSLQLMGLEVFYDDDQQAELLGENLVEYLLDIYKNKSRFCVVVISEHYVKKRWTRHEWKAAQARAFDDFDQAYILPIRLDDSDLPGLVSTIGFLKLEPSSKKSIEHVVGIIFEKVQGAVGLRKVLNLARAAYKRGDYELTCSLLSDDKFKSEILGDHEALRLLGDTELRRGKHDLALPHFNNTTKSFPLDVDAWFQAGVCLVRQGNLEDAIEKFTQTLKIAPGHTTAQAELERISKQRYWESVPGFGFIFRAMSSYSKRSKSLNIAPPRLQ